ncbi:MAG TPA: dihydroorotase [Firmicutes bacterium]|jgi:dihydroorotase|nr:dihydroorotase [Bacillota bacterium]
MRHCIKGGQIIDPAGGYMGIGDLLMDSGKIIQVAPELSGNEGEIIDARGKMVIPGLIDLHSHLREPGREDEETVASGTKAALKGGFTAIACMANTNPVADNPVVIDYLYHQAKEKGYVKVYPVGAVTKGLQGEELAEMGEMAAAGAVAFSDDGKTITNAAVLRTACEYSTLFNLPILLHEEEPKLAGSGVMHEGYWSTILGLPGIPSLAEDVMTARDLLIAEFTKAKVHFCHVSTKGSVELIRQAKSRGVKVTAEATPHHFSLTDESIQGYDPVYRVSPPLRSAEDVQALKEGLKDGTIDAIATDHAPHTLEEKHREFSLAPTGMIGFETALGVAWTELVETGWLTPEQLVMKMSANPARIINRSGGSLKPGEPADVVLFDPRQDWVLEKSQIVSQSKNSPFIGRRLTGRIEAVWVDGVLKYSKERFA